MDNIDLFLHKVKAAKKRNSLEIKISLDDAEKLALDIVRLRTLPATVQVVTVEKTSYAGKTLDGGTF